MCSLDKIKTFDDNFTNWMKQYTGPYVLCNKTNDEHSISQSSEDCESQNENSGFNSEDELLKAKLELLQN